MVRAGISPAIDREFAMVLRRLALPLAGLLLAAITAMSLAHAEKPAHAGNPGKKYDKEVGRGGNQHDRGPGVSIVINEGDRGHIRSYYGDQFRGGHCPPGLAKKNNGCQPPGQAKKWSVGRPLPRELRYYDLPRDLRVRLRPPGDGYKYVRAGADVLLIAIGTLMVIDAVEDLSRL